MSLNKLEGLRFHITPDTVAVVAARDVYPGKEQDTNQQRPVYRDMTEKL